MNNQSIKQHTSDQIFSIQALFAIIEAHQDINGENFICEDSLNCGKAITLLCFLCEEESTISQGCTTCLDLWSEITKVQCLTPGCNGDLIDISIITSVSEEEKED